MGKFEQCQIKTALLDSGVMSHFAVKQGGLELMGGKLDKTVALAGGSCSKTVATGLLPISQL